MSEHTDADTEADTDAGTFSRLLQSTYLAFHRRDGRDRGLTNASRAVLMHLAMTGPVTVGEAATHLDRAQSVVSEIVTGLEGKGLLERERDPDNGRRTLIWLTPAGLERLRAENDVLDQHRLGLALTSLPQTVRSSLLLGLDALVRASDAIPTRAPQRKGTAEP